ncbi:MAG: DUF4810 domain-containing protein [Campylobacteraceae bacterium]|nr:DUF4810 domain-containing protein [Campylobacteraceae bacterium]
MKKNIKIYLFGVLASAVLFTGCGPQAKPPLYHWGQYTKSSLKFFHEEGNPEALQKHKVVLEEIINTSEGKNKKVAPGLYAEFGQLCYQSGEYEKAIAYLKKERTTYPESHKFIDRILKQMGDK